MLSPSWKNRNVSVTSYSKSCTRMWCGSRLWRRSSIAIVTVWTRRASPLEKERRLLRDRGPSKKWRTWKRERPRCCTMYMFRFFYHSGFLFRFFLLFGFMRCCFPISQDAIVDWACVSFCFTTDRNACGAAAGLSKPSHWEGRASRKVIARTRSDERVWSRERQTEGAHLVTSFVRKSLP